MQNEAPTIFGLAAEFLTPEDILRAAQQVRAAGYRHAEAYTPFPVHGLAETLGLRKTIIPYVCLVGAIGGAIAGFLMCWFSTAVDYTWIISGRPMNSWQAYITITIDTMIGGGFFAGLLTMLAQNGLPLLYHPMFNVEAFARATRDRYFLCIEADDEKFDAEVTRSFLTTLQPEAIYAVPK